MRKIITIHQPDFMPWLGLFNKINNADELIVLDHVVNNPKTAHFYCRRVKMMIGGTENWVSVNLKKDPDNLFIPINKMEFNDADKTQFQKLEKTVVLNYKNAPFFKDVFYLVEQYCSSPSAKLVDRNMDFIKEVMKRLEIGTNLVYSSELNVQSKSTSMLVELIKQREGTAYLCGMGASSYQEDELFEKDGIELKYNNFSHPVYTQFNSAEFKNGLSILDALMNMGFDRVTELIRNKV
jgi:hypothetical protein